jgi:hypothetical protein
VKISRQQMREMVTSSDCLLQNAIKKLVLENHAYVIEGLPADLFDEMIDNGIKTAKGFGLTSADKLATFVLLMFEFGPEFYKHPQVNLRLTDASIEPDNRLTTVVDDTPSEIWEHIQSKLHRQTWFPEIREPLGKS